MKCLKMSKTRHHLHKQKPSAFYTEKKRTSRHVRTPPAKSDVLLVVQGGTGGLSRSLNCQLQQPFTPTQLLLRYLPTSSLWSTYRLYCCGASVCTSSSTAVFVLTGKSGSSQPTLRPQKRPTRLRANAASIILHDQLKVC